MENSQNKKESKMNFHPDNTYGKYFEDFEISKVYRHWPGKTITESDNNQFSLITMNHHPIHLDANFSKESQYGKRLVNGTLVFSLSVGLSVRDISGRAIANLDYENITHDAPVFIGDTIYAETIVLSKRVSKSNKDRGIIYVETCVFNQNNEKVLTFRRHVLVPRGIK